MSDSQAKKIQVNKFASVLFADVSGFTDLCEKMREKHKDQAESKLYEILDRLLTGLGKIAKDHHGSVDKFIGDEVMAVWDGADWERGNTEDPDHKPVDAAVEAVAAAKEMKDFVKRFGAENGEPLKIKSGIASGWVAKGTIGGKALTVMGPTVNLAKRLCSAKKNPNDVIVCSTTAGRLKGRWPLRPLFLKLKGIKGKRGDGRVEAYCLDGRSGSSLKYHKVLSKFELREAECRQIRDALAALKEGRGEQATVVVMGESGVGKTYLRRHVLLHEAKEKHGLPVLFPRAGEYEILTDAWVRDLVAGKSEKITEERIVSFLEEHEGLAPFRGYLETLLRHPGRGPSEDKGDPIRGAVGLLVAYSVEKPLVLAAEDLHKSPSETIEAIRLLIEKAAADRGRILVVADTRHTEIIEPLQGRSDSLLIQLEPLSTGEIRRLFDDKIEGRVSDAWITKFREVTGGLLLYIAETLDHFVNSGCLVERPEGSGRWDQARPLDEQEIPLADDVVAERLNRLDPDEKKVFMAAVLLRRIRFPNRLLADALGRNPYRLSESGGYTGLLDEGLFSTDGEETEVRHVRYLEIGRVRTFFTEKENQLRLARRIVRKHRRRCYSGQGEECEVVWDLCRQFGELVPAAVDCLLWRAFFLLNNEPNWTTVQSAVQDMLPVLEESHVPDESPRGLERAALLMIVGHVARHRSIKRDTPEYTRLADAIRKVPIPRVREGILFPFLFDRTEKIEDQHPEYPFEEQMVPTEMELAESAENYRATDRLSATHPQRGASIALRHYRYAVDIEERTTPPPDWSPPAPLLCVPNLLFYTMGAKRIRWAKEYVEAFVYWSGYFQNMEGAGGKLEYAVASVTIARLIHGIDGALEKRLKSVAWELCPREAITKHGLPLDDGYRPTCDCFDRLFYGKNLTQEDAIEIFRRHIERSDDQEHGVKRVDDDDGDQYGFPPSGPA